MSGANIDASSLGTVSSALRADSAATAETVAGERFATFDLAFAGSGSYDLLEFGGIKLVAECSGGNVGIDAVNVSGAGAALQAGWIRDNKTVESSQTGSFNSGSSAILSSIPGDGSGTATVAFADGTITTLIYAYQNATQTGSGCQAFGRAITG